MVVSRSALLAGMLAVATASVAALPAQAQYGGYGRGYDAPEYRDEDDDEGYRPPRRAPYRDYDRRRFDEDDRERRRGYDAPSRAPQARGSFVQSCRDIEQDGAYLSANCRMRGGGYVRSQIDTRICRNVGNRDGQLVCE